MFAYDPSEWSELFVAAAGAGAALAGLVFVAVSINIEPILKLSGVPERALEAVMTLVIVVVVSIVCLIPGQSTAALGIELLVVCGAYTAAVVALWPKTRPPRGSPRSFFIGRIMLKAIATVPLLVGSVTVLAEAGGGLYWIAAGIVCAIAASVTNAWVLLVEIRR